ncbi:MAG: 30S ribosomal protein S2 [Patescibacteria group bacterium]|nr:30S ribosomal protein S2 [Patescibacteria group bacterium]
MDKDLIKKMLDAGVHFGHRTQKWNPKMKPYIYGQRKGIHIFDLEKTYEALRKALEFIKKQVSEGKVVLFVGTKPQALKMLAKAALDTGMPYVVHKWIGGLLTNFDTVKKRIKYLKKLKDEKKSGDFEKYTKKEGVEMSKQIEKLEAALGGVQDMTSMPDVLFVVDSIRDDIAVREALKLKIPVIAITDTNADPTPISYVLPGNDDAIKSLEFFINEVADAILEAKKTKKKL